MLQVVILYMYQGLENLKLLEKLNLYPFYDNFKKSLNLFSFLHCANGVGHIKMVPGFTVDCICMSCLHPSLCQ